MAVLHWLSVIMCQHESLLMTDSEHVVAIIKMDRDADGHRAKSLILTRRPVATPPCSVSPVRDLGEQGPKGAISPSLLQGSPKALCDWNR